MAEAYFVFLICLFSMIAVVKYHEIGGFEETTSNRISALERFEKVWNERLIIREQKRKHEAMLDAFKDCRCYRFPRIEKEIQRLKNDQKKVEECERSKK